MDNWNKNKLGLTKWHSFVLTYDANTLKSARFRLAHLFWGPNCPWRPHNWWSKIVLSTHHLQNITLLCDFLFTFYLSMTVHLCLTHTVLMDWNTTSRLLAKQLVCASAWDNRVMLQRIGLLKVTLALMYVFRVKLAPIWHKWRRRKQKYVNYLAFSIRVSIYEHCTGTAYLHNSYLHTRWDLLECILCDAIWKQSTQQQEPVSQVCFFSRFTGATTLNLHVLA